MIPEAKIPQGKTVRWRSGIPAFVAKWVIGGPKLVPGWIKRYQAAVSFAGLFLILFTILGFCIRGCYTELDQQAHNAKIQTELYRDSALKGEVAAKKIMNDRAIYFIGCYQGSVGTAVCSGLSDKNVPIQFECIAADCNVSHK